MGNTSEKKV